ncbi:hypothetical protein Tco_1073472 [Tanacetum coccineum]
MMERIEAAHDGRRLERDWDLREEIEIVEGLMGSIEAEADLVAGIAVEGAGESSSVFNACLTSSKGGSWSV